MKKSEAQGQQVFAPDGIRFLVNREDGNNIAQIYLGKTGNSTLACITDTQQPGGPKPNRFKMQPVWHPSGKWIFLAVERD